jgi:hypothetical protein
MFPAVNQDRDLQQEIEHGDGGRAVNISTDKRQGNRHSGAGR